MSSTDHLVSRRFVGQVKWFNNKAGFGFVTMKNNDGEHVDIFTHYSTVHVTDAQYKYLVQGEYVEFDLVESANTKHAFQAANITGINGGNLMCETRQLNRPEKRRETTERRETTDRREPTDRRETSDRREPRRQEGDYKKVVTKKSRETSQDHQRQKR